MEQSTMMSEIAESSLSEAPSSAPKSEETEEERSKWKRRAAVLLVLLGLLLLALSLAALLLSGKSGTDVEAEVTEDENESYVSADRTTVFTPEVVTTTSPTTTPARTSKKSTTTVKTTVTTPTTKQTTTPTTKQTTTPTTKQTTTPTTKQTTTPTTKQTTTTKRTTTPTTRRTTTPTTKRTTTPTTTTRWTTTTTTEPPLPPGSLKRKRLPGQIMCEINMTSPVDIAREIPHNKDSYTQVYRTETYDPREKLISKVPLECDVLVLDSYITLIQREVTYIPSLDIYDLEPRVNTSQKDQLRTLMSWGNTSLLLRYTMYAGSFYGNILFDTARLVRSFNRVLTTTWKMADGIMLEFRKHDFDFYYYCMMYAMDKLRSCHPDGQMHNNAIRLFKFLREDFKNFVNQYNEHMKLYYIYTFVCTVRDHMDFLQEIVENVDFLVKSIYGASTKEINSFSEKFPHHEKGLSLDEFLDDVQELDRRGYELRTFGVAVGVTGYTCHKNPMYDPSATCISTFNDLDGSLWCFYNNGDQDIDFVLNTTGDYYWGGNYHAILMGCYRQEEIFRFQVLPQILGRQVREANMKIKRKGLKMVLQWRDLRRDEPDPLTNRICSDVQFPYFRELVKAMRP